MGKGAQKPLRIAAAGSRIAFFGGSFDPPHLGHLAVARAAQAALALDTVLFAPVGAQPLKPQGSTADFEDRLAMTRLAIAAEPLLGLRGELGPGSVLFCLMGADSFASFRRWHRAAEIPFAAALIVASRPGEGLSDLRAALPTGLTIDAAPEPATRQLRRYLLRNPADELTPLYLLPGLDIPISATQIRAQLRSAAPAPPPDELLPPPVLEYIRAHGLYR
jgi:nicotinate-nucleotide adenylyltransferase